ncbi:transient receptor potential cation channel subfamily M member 8-like [Crassostrea virginica]
MMDGIYVDVSVCNGLSKGSDFNSRLDEINTFIDIHYYQEDGQERPNMIFSVIGDSYNIVPKIWPKSRLQDSLTNAARAAGKSWILSRGEPTKISKTVREMVEEYVYLETPLNSTKSPVRLVSIPSKPVDDETLYFDLPEKYEDDKTNEKFLLNLNGGRNLSDMDYILFRLNLEKRLSNPKVKDKTAVVIVLVEGDLSAIEHVKLAVENNIPVVIIEGTGGAADLLAEFISADTNDHVKVLLPALFGITLAENETDELTESLTFIKQKANYVDVFDLQNKDEEHYSAMVGELVQRTWSSEVTSKEFDSIENVGIGVTDTKSYCKSTSWIRNEIRWRGAKTLPTSWFSSFTSPFSLPLDFFFGFSKYLGSRESHSENPELQEKLDEKLLLLALTSNRTDYIETLLDLNISLSEENINKLYWCSMKKEKKISTMIKKQQNEKEEEGLLQWVITDIGGQISRHLLQGRDAHVHAQKIIKHMLQYKETVDPRLEAACYSNRRKAYIKRQFSLQAILLWSLFFNRVNISTMIWKRVANQLYTGLVSTVILQKLSEVARLKDELLANEISDHSVIFKKRVCNMMDTLSKKNKEDTFTILDSLETVWKIQAKPIFFAYEFQLYDVIAHPTSVAWMDQKWYNGLIPNWKRFIRNIKVHPSVALQALCFRFLLHYVLFGVVLLMYSYFLLTPLETYKEASMFHLSLEMALYVWTTLDFWQDLMNVMEETRRKSGFKFLFQLNDMWKALGFLCFLLAVASFLSRMKQTETFTLAKRFCALLLIFSYLRCSRVFAIHRFTGRSFMFLRYMSVHLVQFLFVTIFMIVGVGIFYQALLNDNESMSIFSGKWYKWKIWYIIYYPYYQLYGEPFDDVLGFSHKDDHDIDWTVTFVAAMYMLVAHLLVICLITAMFTTKYEKVLEQSQMMWQYERFRIISDFRNRWFANLDVLLSPITYYRYHRIGVEKIAKSHELFRNYRHLQILQYIMAGRSLEKST